VKAQAAATDRMVRVDCRGQQLMAGFLTRYAPARKDGRYTLTLSGLDALSLLAWTLAWPQPANPIDQQTLWDGQPAPIGPLPMEACVLRVIRENVVARRT